MVIEYHGIEASVLTNKSESAYFVVVDGGTYEVHSNSSGWVARQEVQRGNDTENKKRLFTDTLQQSNKSKNYENPLLAIKRCLLHHANQY